MLLKSNTIEFNKPRLTEFIIDGDSEFSWLGQFESDEFDRFIIFYDNKLEDNWLKIILSKLRIHKKKIIIISLDASEKTKSLDFYTELIDKMESEYCSKLDLAIIIGGGTILDLMTFTASTYMRGMPSLLVPTTLIGQIDATTAGKTCLNTGKVKNLLGTFYYPRFVYNNINTLETNSYFYLRQGMSEALKYGLLDSKKLVDKLKDYSITNSKKNLVEIIDLTIKSRIKISKIDPYASNLGHTFGHALEKISNYKVLHGDAINVGTVMALHFSVYEGLIKESLVNEIMGIMKNLNLNLYIDRLMDIPSFVQLMKKDKKSMSGMLNLVLIKNIGNTYEDNGHRFYRTEAIKVEKFLMNFIKNYKYSVNDFPSCINKEIIQY